MDTDLDSTFGPHAALCLQADFKEALHKTNRRLATLRLGTQRLRQQNLPPSPDRLAMERRLSRRARTLHKAYIRYAK